MKTLTTATIKRRRDRLSKESREFNRIQNHKIKKLQNRCPHEKTTHTDYYENVLVYCTICGKTTFEPRKRLSI